MKISYLINIISVARCTASTAWSVPNKIVAFIWFEVMQKESMELKVLQLVHNFFNFSVCSTEPGEKFQK